MPYSIEQKVFGLTKEAVRGTAEAAVGRFIPVDRATELDYKLNLIEDEQLRGMFDRLSPQSGTKEGAGTLTGIDVQSDNVGEIFHSLLGSVVSSDVGTAGEAYKHVFSRAAGISLPSYTIFANRGISAKAYPLSIVKSIALNGTMDGKAKLDASILFKNEVTTAATFAPVWDEPIPFMFFQTEVKIAGGISADVRSYSLNIDNQSLGLRSLNNSQDVRDIIAPGKLLANGTFEIYFETEAERAKFLANTASSFEINLVGSVIETGQNHRLKIALPKIHYTAFPYGELDGLLGAAVAFNAYYTAGVSPAAALSVELTNKIASY